MKNELLDKGIILLSGEIGKDKINLAAGQVTVITLLERNRSCHPGAAVPFSFFAFL